MNEIVPIKKEDQPHEQTAVERSIARPDAFMKPGTVGRGTNAVRIRLANPNPKSARPRKRKRDPRAVNFY